MYISDAINLSTSILVILRVQMPYSVLMIFVCLQLFSQASAALRKFMLRAMTPELSAHLVQLASNTADSARATGRSNKGQSRSMTAVDRLLYDYFVAYTNHSVSFQAQVKAYKQAVSTLDLRAPHTWYPFARALKRKIIYHGGKLS